MYCQHFNLGKKPFQISSDNDFLWLGKTHTAALDLLKKGIEQQQGVLALTGDVGTGKTTLLNEIVHTLDRETLFVKIPDPGVEMSHLFSTIAMTLGFADQYQQGSKFSSDFFSFLNIAGEKGEKVLIIVDEAQRIPKRFLREIASWSGFGLNRVLTVILAGQLEFRRILPLVLGPAWQNCIKVHAFLEPLNKEETKSYINKRLETAGATRNIFLISAVNEIHAYSKGIPRMINISCDKALLAAFLKETKIVDTPIVSQITRQLTLPAVPIKKARENAPSKTNIPRHDKPWVSKINLAGLLLAACVCIVAGLLFTRQYPFPVTPLPVSPVKTTSPDSLSQNDSSPEKTRPKQDAIKKAPPSNLVIQAMVPVPEKNDLPPDVTPLAPKSLDPKPIEPEFLGNQKSESQNIGLGYTREQVSENRNSPAPVLIEDIHNTSRTAIVVNDSKGMDQFVQEVFFMEQKFAAGEDPAGPETAPGLGQLPTPTPVGRADSALDNQMDVSGTSEEPEPDAIIDWLLEKRNAE